MPVGNLTDREFVAELKEAIGQFFRAIDDWEKAYRKYYRLPGPPGRIPADLEEQQRAYTASYKRLAALVPRAQGLSFRYGVRDPWTNLLRTSLGQHAPQDRSTSALSRGERDAVNECLVLLTEAVAEFGSFDPETPRAGRSLLRKIFDFFY